MPTPKNLQIGFGRSRGFACERAIATVELALVLSLLVITAVIPFITRVQPRIRELNQDSSIASALAAFTNDQMGTGIERPSGSRDLQGYGALSQILVQRSTQLAQLDSFNDYCTITLRKKKVQGKIGEWALAKVPKRTDANGNGHRMGYDNHGKNCNSDKTYKLMPKGSTDHLPQGCVKIFNQQDYGDKRYNMEIGVISFPIRDPKTVKKTHDVSNEPSCQLYDSRYQPK